MEDNVKSLTAAIQFGASARMKRRYRDGGLKPQAESLVATNASSHGPVKGADGQTSVTRSSACRRTEVKTDGRPTQAGNDITTKKADERLTGSGNETMANGDDYKPDRRSTSSGIGSNTDNGKTDKEPEQRGNDTIVQATGAAEDNSVLCEMGRAPGKVMCRFKLADIGLEPFTFQKWHIMERHARRIDIKVRTAPYRWIMKQKRIRGKATRQEMCVFRQVRDEDVKNEDVKSREFETRCRGEQERERAEGLAMRLADIEAHETFTVERGIIRM